MSRLFAVNDWVSFGVHIGSGEPVYLVDAESYNNLYLIDVRSGDEMILDKFDANDNAACLYKMPSLNELASVYTDSLLVGSKS